MEKQYRHNVYKAAGRWLFATLLTLCCLSMSCITHCPELFIPSVTFRVYDKNGKGILPDKIIYTVNDKNFRIWTQKEPDKWAKDLSCHLNIQHSHCTVTAFEKTGEFTFTLEWKGVRMKKTVQVKSDPKSGIVSPGHYCNPITESFDIIFPVAK